MIGFEITFKENDEFIDTNLHPIFDANNADIVDAMFYLDKPNTSIEISKNEYWGDESDYDFNDCLDRKEFSSVMDFKNYCESQGLLTE